MDFAASPGSLNTSEALQSLGYPSFLAFAEVFKEWLDTHRWALRQYAKAYVILNGGVEWSQDPQKMLWLTVTPRWARCASSSRDVSQRFELTAHEIIDLEDILTRVSPDCVLRWLEDGEYRHNAHQFYGADPLYAGLFPVMFEVEGAGVSQARLYPLYRSAPAALPAILNPLQAAEDIVTLCLGSINHGFPLRDVGHGPPHLAFPGAYVRHRGTWAWRPFFYDWDQYQGGACKELDETLSQLKAGATVPELLFLFRRL